MPRYDVFLEGRAENSTRYFAVSVMADDPKEAEFLGHEAGRVKHQECDEIEVVGVMSVTSDLNAGKGRLCWRIPLKERALKFVKEAMTSASSRKMYELPVLRRLRVEQAQTQNRKRPIHKVLCVPLRENSPKGLRACFDLHSQKTASELLPGVRPPAKENKKEGGNVKGTIRGRCPKCGGEIIVSEYYQTSRDYKVRMNGKLSKRYIVTDAGSVNAMTASCGSFCGAYWEDEELSIGQDGTFYDNKYTEEGQT